MDKKIKYLLITLLILVLTAIPFIIYYLVTKPETLETVEIFKNEIPEELTDDLSNIYEEKLAKGMPYDLEGVTWYISEHTELQKVYFENQHVKTVTLYGYLDLLLSKDEALEFGYESEEAEIDIVLDESQNSEEHEHEHEHGQDIYEGGIVDEAGGQKQQVHFILMVIFNSENEVIDIKFE